MILSAQDKRHIAVVLEKTQTITNDILGPITWEPVKVFDGILYYTGTQCFVINNTFRVDANAEFIANPKDIKNSDFKPEGRVVVFNKKDYQDGICKGHSYLNIESFYSNSGKFKVTYVEDVEGLGEVAKIKMKRTDI